MRLNNLLRFFILFCISIIGCTNTNNTPSVISLPTRTSIPTTETLILPTQTITPTSTPTIIPTLSVDDARKRLLDLLANNGYCRLPCLWGITPGISTNQEAQLILSPLSGITYKFDLESNFDPTGGFISASYTEGDGNLMLKAETSYLSDSQVVSRIHFQAFEEKVDIGSNGDWTSKRPIFGLPTFIQRTEYYSLFHLLAEQGIPASVMIRTSGPSYNRSGSITFYLAVFYPSQGIWAEYTTLTNESDVGSVIRSCPVDAHIQMELFPLGDSDNFYKKLDQTDWVYVKEGYRPLEEGASMTVRQFHETFRNPTDKCIETPVEIWPTPER